MNSSKPFETALAPEARLLVTAERLYDAHRPRVHRDLTRAHPPRNALRERVILRIHRARQSVVGVVRDRDGLVDRVERDDDQHRAEDLLLGDPHIVGHVGEQGRFDVEAGVRVRRDSAAGHEAGSLLLADLDVVEHATLLSFGGKRTEEGVVLARIPDLEALHHGLDPADDLLLAFARHEKAGQRRAHLAGVPDAREHSVREDLVEVDVVGDDGRRLAAQLQGHPLDVACARYP